MLGPVEIPEGFFNCRYLFSATGVIDQFGFGIAGQADVGMDVDEIATTCYDAWAAQWGGSPAAIFVGYSFLGTQVTKTLAGAPIIGQHLATINGTGSIGAPSLNLAVLVRKQTASGGRKNRGRLFMPPINLDEDNVAVSGVLSGGYQDAQQIKFDAFHDALVGDLVPPWLLHSDPADAPVPITGFAVQSLCATQRRRMR